MTKKQSKSTYLLAPLLAGGFLALGYGITHRTLVAIGSWEAISKEVFTLNDEFPGKNLRNLEIEARKLKPKEISKDTIKISIDNKAKLKNLSSERKSIDNKPASTNIIFEATLNSKEKKSIFSKEMFDMVLKTLPES